MMRLYPNITASSTTASVTSRHNKAHVASASVSPTCSPALSNPSCKGRGANLSRAPIISLILISLRKFGAKIRISSEKIKQNARILKSVHHLYPLETTLFLSANPSSTTSVVGKKVRYIRHLPSQKVNLRALIP